MENEAAAASGQSASLVSVVVPHLNQPEALRRCLESLAGQDWPGDRTEIIVVDNGSDALPELSAWGFSDVILLSEPAPGPGHARNRGVVAAQGGILAFIDADCRAHPGWLTSAVAGLADAGASGVVGGDVRIDVADHRRLTPLESYESVFAYRQQLYIRRDGYSGTGNLAVRRQVMECVGGFADIQIAEDMDWGNRAKRAGHPTRYCPDMIVWHPARTSFGELKQKWRRHIAHARASHLADNGSDWRWSARAVSVLLSSVPHIVLMLTSPRLAGLGDRMRGIPILLRIRAYRFAEMMRLLRGGIGEGSQGWNRGDRAA